MVDDDGWMDEEMMEGLSKTIVRGKQNNTILGVVKKWNIYMTHKARIVAVDSARLRGRALAMATWNSKLSEHFVQCFESNGLDQAKVFLMSVCVKYKRWGVTHYPSTPASKALRLSSRVDIPVRARMRVFLKSGSVDSIRRISFVAPTPSSSGIDMSRSTILMFNNQYEEQATICLSPTRIVLQFRTFLRHRAHQRLQLRHIPDIKPTGSAVT
jgi:hypothetical protein